MNNLERTHSIDDLAERVAMSRRTFTRHFSKATGMTLVDWLVGERLRLTRELLETTSLSIDRIAGMAGFQTIADLRHSVNASWSTPMQAEKRMVGDDYDESAFVRLKHALGDLQYSIQNHWNEVAGS